MTITPLSQDLLNKVNTYWRPANYLFVGQIYLYDIPLLKKPLTLCHVKPLVVGPWGTTPGQYFIYIHLNVIIKKHSFPGSISSHVAPTTPSSIHEGGELGYSLSHAVGVAFNVHGQDMPESLGWRWTP